MQRYMSSRNITYMLDKSEGLTAVTDADVSLNEYEPVFNNDLSNPAKSVLTADEKRFLALAVLAYRVSPAFAKQLLGNLEA